MKINVPTSQTFYSSCACCSNLAKFILTKLCRTADRGIELINTYLSQVLNSVGLVLLSADPLDSRYVYVKGSESLSGAGESLYASRDIPSGTVIALLSGFIMSSKEIRDLTEDKNKDFNERGVPLDAQERYDSWKYR